MDIASRIAAYGGHSIIETTLGMSDSKAWKAFVTWFMGLAIIFTGLGFMAGNEIGAANGLADLTTLLVSITGLIVGIIAIATIWYIILWDVRKNITGWRDMKILNLTHALM